MDAVRGNGSDAEKAEQEPEFLHHFFTIWLDDGSYIDKYDKAKCNKWI